MTRYDIMKDEDELVILLDNDIITTIQAKNWYQHFRKYYKL